MANRDLLSKTMIEPARPEFRALFENLQGNILKSHARDLAVLIFFRIKTGKTGAARSWIRSFAAEHVTSAKRQLMAGPLRHILPNAVSARRVAPRRRREAPRDTPGR